MVLSPELEEWFGESTGQNWIYQPTVQISAAKNANIGCRHSSCSSSSDGVSNDRNLFEIKGTRISAQKRPDEGFVVKLVNQERDIVSTDL